MPGYTESAWDEFDAEETLLNPGTEPPSRRRRSLRLRSYDYSQAGAYFVSITVQKRLSLFGHVTGEQMRLNDAGRMIQEIWRKLPQRFPTIQMDQFVVMPNHLHGIILINDGPPTNSAPKHTSAIRVGVPLVGTQQQDARESMRTPTRCISTKSGRIALGDVIGAYKSLTTLEYTRGVRIQNWPSFHRRLWQRNYYEHVVRNDESLLRIREYILYNPARWAFDRENPLAIDLPSKRA